MAVAENLRLRTGQVRGIMDEPPLVPTTEINTSVPILCAPWVNLALSIWEPPGSVVPKPVGFKFSLVETINY